MWIFIMNLIINYNFLLDKFRIYIFFNFYYFFNDISILYLRKLGIMLCLVSRMIGVIFCVILEDILKIIFCSILISVSINICIIY